MKTFKVLLAVVGMVSATIVSSSSVQAQRSVETGTGLDAGAGHCAPTNANCGRTASGTVLYGSWYE